MMTAGAKEARLAPTDISAEIEYWKEQATRAEPVVPRLRRRRPEEFRPRTGSFYFDIEGEVYRRLRTLTGGELFLQYAAVTAAVTLCLHRYSGSSPIAVGCPALASSDEPDAQNVLVIVNDIEDQTTFREFLLNVRQTLLEAHARQNVPLASLLSALGIQPAPNRCPLFDVAITFTDLHRPMPEVQHDIALVFRQLGSHLSAQACYSPELYQPETIELFCRHVTRALESALENTQSALADLEILTREERALQLVEWNSTAHDFPADRSIHELFEAQAERNPNATALVCAGQRFTYGQLNQQANRLGNYLQTLGVKTDTLVGIALDRCPELIVAVLGVLKAGGAYVPYDPAYPSQRLQAMAEDVRVKVLLTKEAIGDRLRVRGAHVVLLDRDWEKIEQVPDSNPPVSSGPANMCYVIFTSGSTGRPKAAAVCHRGWTNLVHWFVTDFEIGPNDKTLVMSSFSFDITQRSIAMPLISGGELHLESTNQYQPESILETIEQERITILNCAPSTFYPLIEDAAADGPKRLRSLRRLFLGGEAISASRIRAWAESGECQATIANVYGAAESTDVSSSYRLHDFERYAETSTPIGKPIYNSEVYVLDDKLRPLPIGSVGEICLGGIGVGKGYLNDAALTAEKFVNHPFVQEPGAKLYRTGDLGRFLPDGTLEFAGRLDHQAKIRGQRIELGEIETALRGHPSVKEAVLITTEPAAGDVRLIAYFVPAADLTEGARQALVETVRNHLANKLPRYMMPNLFVALAKMPLNPNGKIDRGALPRPDAGTLAGVATKPAPHSATEEKVARLYQSLLGVEEVGPHDDFFNLGGHSLLATQVISQISKTFQIRFPAQAFFAEPTVASIARRVDQIVSAQGAS